MVQQRQQEQEQQQKQRRLCGAFAAARFACERVLPLGQGAGPVPAALVAAADRLRIWGCFACCPHRTALPGQRSVACRACVRRGCPSTLCGAGPLPPCPPQAGVCSAVAASLLLCCVAPHSALWLTRPRAPPCPRRLRHKWGPIPGQEPAAAANGETQPPKRKRRSRWEDSTPSAPSAAGGEGGGEGGEGDQSKALMVMPTEVTLVNGYRVSGCFKCFFHFFSEWGRWCWPTATG